MKHLLMLSSVATLALVTPLTHAADKGQGLVATDTAGHSELVTLTAKVIDVNHHKQTLVLEGPKGNALAIKVDEKVQNFKHIKKGDLVSVKYYESVLWEIVKAKPGDEPSKQVSELDTTGVSQPGKRPEMAQAKVTHVTTLIKSVDKATSTVILEGADGQDIPLQVKDKSSLAGLQVGDKIVATYTEALAVSIEPAPKS